MRPCWNCATPTDLVLARRMFLGRRNSARGCKTLAFAQQGNPHDRRCRPLYCCDATAAQPRLISPDMIRGTAATLCLLHEGKTIHQFSDRWDTLPRYAISAGRAGGQAARPLESAHYYRAACREIARSTDERTAIAAMLPPGVLCGHTISVERTPGPAAQRRGTLAGRRDEQLSVRLAAATEGGQRMSACTSCRNCRCRDWRRTRNGFLAHAALRCAAIIAASLPVARTARRYLAEASPRRSWPVIAARSRSVAAARGNGCRRRSCIRARPRAV